MGGYIALKMLEFYAIDTLLLFCPALYDRKAYDVQFDEGFSSLIRVPESWMNTDVLHLLSQFKGKLLIVTGSEDKVIPRKVIDLIFEAATSASLKEIYEIPNCPHQIPLWLNDRFDEQNRLTQKMLDFLSL
jgi:pimeloyl-ACP methyl ester carboxylesterase